MYYLYHLYYFYHRNISSTNFMRYHWLSLIINYYHWLSENPKKVNHWLTNNLKSRDASASNKKYRQSFEHEVWFHEQWHFKLIYWIWILLCYILINGMDLGWKSSTCKFGYTYHWQLFLKIGKNSFKSYFSSFKFSFSSVHCLSFDSSPELRRYRCQKWAWGGGTI